MSQLHFAQRVVAWQRLYGRNHLPWSEKSPYHVWLSEVMLQQTQVATVLPYYATFIREYPDVSALAGAAIDDVLALWAGLGYYSRARHLHRCAQVLVQQYGGIFPTQLVDLEALPGIGPSTAAAIASLAMGQRAAILDGNVKRVLARHAGVLGWPGTPNVAKQLWAIANERLIPQTIPCTDDHHRRYTQGLMDLGATVCTAKKPNCQSCPIAADCSALHQHLIETIPQRRPKKVVPIQTRCALVLHDANGLWLQRRAANGLWGGLLSLPESDNQSALAEIAVRLGATDDLKPWHIHQIKHTFTHYHLHWQIWSIAISDVFKLPHPWVYATWDDVDAAGVPTAVLKVLGK
jgi:A/G-specific adenine glycosylase